MTKPRIIKSHEQHKLARPAKSQPRPVSTESKMKAIISEWKEQWQTAQPQNAREQFAALFA